jgi:hypothetical protein
LRGIGARRNGQAVIVWNFHGASEVATHEVPIAPRRVLVFRPSHVLKASINGEEMQEVEVEMMATG